MSHPSTVVLERYSVDDLPPQPRQDTAKHLSACDSCRCYVDELGQSRATRLGTVPADLFAKQVAERRDQHTRRIGRRAAFGVATAALAAAAMFVLVPRTEEAIRFKGDSIVIHRSRGSEVRILEDGDRIRAGDALRMVLTLPKATSVAAWFVDARGRVDRVADGLSVNLTAGEQALPGSAIVETPCVDSWVVVVTGTGATETTEAALRSAVRGGVPDTSQWIPPGSRARFLKCE